MFPLVLDLIFLVAYIHKSNVSLFIIMSQVLSKIVLVKVYRKYANKFTASLSEPYRSAKCGYMLCYVSRPNKFTFSRFIFKSSSRFIFKSSAINILCIIWSNSWSTVEHISL